jgi:hypothetical protein
VAPTLAACDGDGEQLQLQGAPLLPLLPSARPLAAGRSGASGGAEAARGASRIPLDFEEEGGDGEIPGLLKETAAGGETASSSEPDAVAGADGLTSYGGQAPRIF